MSDRKGRSEDDVSSQPTAERAFLRFMLEGRDLSDDAFEDLCRENPELDAELRSLRGQWKEALEGTPPASPTTSLREEIKKRFGSQADPEVSLEPDDSKKAEGGITSGAISRLELHRGQRDRYEVRGEVARGGMGAILRVRDEDLRRSLAMKVMLRGGVGDQVDARHVRRFLEEAQVTGQLDHPGVVPVHELGIDTKGKLFFTMRLVRGITFRKVIDLTHAGEEDWTLVRALGVLQKVCEAMAFAHAKGVVHRDLKPANIMVGRYGETYVMDWGLARVMGQEDAHDIRLRTEAPSTDLSEVHTEREDSPDSPLLTADGDVVGTPAYMPPEQATGRIENIGPASDVYSVGAILYHLLTGQAPYCPRGARLSAHTVLGLVINGPPKPVHELASDAPGGLVAICEKAMARDPEERYVDMQEMAADLRAYQESRPVAARPFTAAYALRLAYQRNRAAVLTGAAALVVIVLTTVLFISRLQDEVQAKERKSAEAELAWKAGQRRLHVLNARAYVLEEPELHPAVRRMIAKMETWLADVDALLESRDAYESHAGGDEPLPDIEAEELTELLGNMDRLQVLRGRVASRLDDARGLSALTVRHAMWDEALPDIEDRYDLDSGMAPQLGLIPLWRDLESGLWEFWHVASGDKPERDPDTGQIIVTEKTGIVLVLLEGGPYYMGSPESEAHLDPFEDETLHLVTLDPFFLSKYETTQGQWIRMMDGNPSARVAGSEMFGQQFTLLNPVESINWREADRLARRYDLLLPTEAQWEYACRVGRRSPFACGDDPDCFELQANVLDLSFPEESTPYKRAEWHDNFPFHAPIGSFPPNGYGLFDMYGNVSEWCRDPKNAYPPDSLESGDGLLPQGADIRHVLRGGNWLLPPKFSRSAQRQADRPEGLNMMRGVRLSRDVR